MSKEIYRQMVAHKTWDEKGREFCWTDPKYYDMSHGPYALSHRRRLIFERRIDIVERMLLKIFRGDMHKLAGKKVLDVGAGVGSMALGLATWGAEVTALDNQEKFAEIIENKLTWLGGHGVAGNAYSLPFEDESFDIILSTNFIDVGTLSDKNREKIVREMKRVLKPGCYMIHTIRNGANPYVRRSGRDPITKDKVRRLHSKLGLQLVEIKAYSSPSPWPGAKNIFIDLAQALPIDTFKAAVYFISRKRKA